MLGCGEPERYMGRGQENGSRSEGVRITHAHTNTTTLSPTRKGVPSQNKTHNFHIHTTLLAPWPLCPLFMDISHTHGTHWFGTSTTPINAWHLSAVIGLSHSSHTNNPSPLTCVK